MLFGPDLSNYQKDFSLGDAYRLAQKQCTFVVVGRQARNVWARQQVDFCRWAGMPFVAEYLMNINGVWPELFPETRYVGIDVEAGSEFNNEAAIDAGLEWVRQQGRTPLIYSSKYQWDMAGLQALTKYGERAELLWNAHYDGMTDGYELKYPFGGWTRCALDQYTESWDEGGLGYPLDMNNCEDSLFVQVQPIWVPAPEITPPAAPQPRRLNVASDPDVQAWLAPLSNTDRYSPSRFEVVNGVQFAVYDDVKVRLP